MRVLVGCEQSQIVTAAFIQAGHDAMSCDINYDGAKGLPHYRGDVRDLFGRNFDLFIVHPECKYLCNSGIKHLYVDGRKKNGRYEPRWIEMKKAADFFLECLNAPFEKIAAENPIPHPYAMEIIGQKHDQIIQPWMFGHGETKATCLWLKGVQKLQPTNEVSGREQHIWKMSPGLERSKKRSETFPGIAQAMVVQWGCLGKTAQPIES